MEGENFFQFGNILRMVNLIRFELLVYSACGLSCVRLFGTPWTVSHQAPRPWNFPGKNTGEGCLFPLQGTFPTQGWNLSLSRLFTTSATVSYCSTNLSGMQQKAFTSHFVGHKGRSARVTVLVHLGCSDKTL